MLRMWELKQQSKQDQVLSLRECPSTSPTLPLEESSSLHAQSSTLPLQLIASLTTLVLPQTSLNIYQCLSFCFILLILVLSHSICNTFIRNLESASVSLLVVFDLTNITYIPIPNISNAVPTRNESA